MTSLELLQQHAMGKDNKNLSTWLESMNLGDNQRLAEFIDVESGWDTAVETVLGSYLEAICVANTEPVIPGLHRLTNESLTLFETRAKTAKEHFVNGGQSLLDKVNAPWDLSALLNGVYCADDNESASALSAHTNPHESVITPDGWFGPGG